MIKYKTREYSRSLLGNISNWLNSIEEERNGRSNSEYGFEIFDKTVSMNGSLILTLKIFDYAGPLKECYFCGRKEKKYHEMPLGYIVDELACWSCRNLDTKTLLNIKNNKK